MFEDSPHIDGASTPPPPEEPPSPFLVGKPQDAALLPKALDDPPNVARAVADPSITNSLLIYECLGNWSPELAKVYGCGYLPIETGAQLTIIPHPESGNGWVFAMLFGSSGVADRVNECHVCGWVPAPANHVEPTHRAIPFAKFKSSIALSAENAAAFGPRVLQFGTGIDLTIIPHPESRGSWVLAMCESSGDIADCVNGCHLAGWVHHAFLERV